MGASQEARVRSSKNDPKLSGSLAAATDSVDLYCLILLVHMN